MLAGGFLEKEILSMPNLYHQPFPSRNKAPGTAARRIDDHTNPTLAEAMALGSGGGSLVSSGQVSGHTNTLGWKNFKQDKEEPSSLKETLFEVNEFGELSPSRKNALATLLQQLQNVRTYKDLRDTVQSSAESLGLKYLGEGESRIVFAVNENVVIKIAFAQEELGKLNTEQNREEVRAASCVSQYPEFFARIIDWDRDNFFWVTAERLDTENQLQELNKWLEYKIGKAGVRILDRWFPKPTQAFQNGSSELHEKLKAVSPWCKSLFSALEACELTSYDLHEENWGMRRNGDWAIIDYGATLNSWKEKP